jgi:hypothetical protein
MTLLTGLGSAMFQTRESSEETLTGLATQHLLTADQIKSIQNLVVSTDLEVQQRAGRIFAAFVQTLPSYQAIMSLVGTQQTRAPTFNFDGSINQPGRYTFDEAGGSYKSPQSITNRNLLETGWAMVNEALRVCNVAAATTALQNLRAAIAALPADAFNTSFLAPDNGGPRLNQNAVLGKIDDALNEMKAFMLDLQFFGAQNEPALPPPVGIAVAGVISLGQSLSLSLTSLSAPGSLLVTSFDTTSGAPALPPPDYAFLGPIFDLEAEDGLSTSGEIGISIKYGSAALPGIPSSELPDVQIVRIANGQDSLLPTTFTSPDFLTADYVPFANAVGSDQFGEFGLVIAVPEASTWSMLLAAGAMLVVARGLRRRPAYARRS